MKGLRIFGHLLAGTLRSFRGSWLLHGVTALAIATTFAVMGGTYLLTRNLKDLFVTSRGGVHVSVYFRSGAPAQARSAVEKEFCRRGFVARCEFRSAQGAKARFLEENPGFEEAVASLEENPFPASMEIEVDPAFRDRAALESFAKGLARVEGVEAVDDGGEWSARWISVLNLADGFLALLVLGLALAAAFLVGNTVKLVVISRRDEVEILSLVGATDTMIRTPFVLEGFLHGAAGAALAAGLLKVLFHLAAERIGAQAGLFAFSFRFLSPPALAGMLAAGAALGTLGSFLAVRRYLK